MFRSDLVLGNNQILQFIGNLEENQYEIHIANVDEENRSFLVDEIDCSSKFGLIINI